MIEPPPNHQPTCGRCKHFRAAPGDYGAGGFCGFEPPVDLAHLLWGHTSKRIVEERPACSLFVDGGGVMRRRAHRPEGALT